VAVAEPPPPAHPLEPELPFEPGEVPPRPIVWLHPWELLRTAYRSLLSTAATGFLDRRETLATLHAPPERPVHSTPAVLRPSADGRTLVLGPRTARPLWIDYVADIGDSWDATYATTSLVAREKLNVRGLDEELPGGHILAIGGDLVYPWPSRDGYRTRTRSALIAALPTQPDRTPSVVAIPGNHDWYDGLTSFVREFCQGTAIGGWRLDQRRSYFAAELFENWWLWGVDIALDSRIDSPQQAYFFDVMKEFRRRREEKEGKGNWDEERNPLMKIILCTAKPVWLDHPRLTTDAYNNLAYFLDLVRAHEATVPVILAGDTHHYSRFEDRRGHQMIVCGGGGAYAAGTHQVPLQVDRVAGRRSHRAARQQHPRVKPPARLPGADPPDADSWPEDRRYRSTDHCYPSREESRRLALRALLLIRRYENWPFIIFLGLLYALFAWTPDHDISRLMAGSFADLGLRLRDAFSEPLPWRAWLAGITVMITSTSYGATASTHGSWLLRAAWGALHGLAHLTLALWVYGLFGNPRLHLTAASFGTWLPETVAYIPVAWCVRLLVYIVIAGALGTTLLGAYLVLSDRWFAWHSDEVFSFQGIYDYRSFLRMQLAVDGSLTIYPIGLQRTPRRWRARAEVSRTSKSKEVALEAKENPGLYEPGDAVLRPHSIEAPISLPRG
jgi:hypothetical protein